MRTPIKASHGLLTAVLTAGLTGTSLGITVSPQNDAGILVSAILGSGVTVVGTPTFIGTSTSAGTFTDGISSGIGIGSGIVLTSGDATLIGNTNTSDAASSDNGLAGDTDLSALVGGAPTFDATILEFQFQFGDGTIGGNLFFNYVFGSEEYNEFTNSSFNDVFGFFLDGINVALLPDGVTPVSINNVNGGNPLGTNASNPGLFNNNDLVDGGPFFNFEYDGFTDVFSVTALGLSPGVHTIKLAIADGGDFVVDSGVFIQGGTFSNNPTPPGNGNPQGVPDGGSTLALFGMVAALGCGTRLGRRLLSL